MSEVYVLITLFKHRIHPALIFPRGNTVILAFFDVVSIARNCGFPLREMPLGKGCMRMSDVYVLITLFIHRKHPSLIFPQGKTVALAFFDIIAIARCFGFPWREIPIGKGCPRISDVYVLITLLKHRKHPTLIFPQGKTVVLAFF